MINTGKLKVSASGDREIVMTRSFNAPRRLVFDAFTKPELVRQWLLGPDGWSMPVCEIDLRVGGKYRYVWRRDSDGTSMGMGGVDDTISRHHALAMKRCVLLFAVMVVGCKQPTTNPLRDGGGTDGQLAAALRHWFSPGEDVTSCVARDRRPHLQRRASPMIRARRRRERNSSADKLLHS